MEFLKSAEDIACHSITAFCHVHKGDFGFEVDKECFNFDIKGHAKLISTCCEHSCLSKAIRPSRLVKKLGGTSDMRQSKTLILSTNVDKIVSSRVLGCNLSPDYGSRKHCFRVAIFYRRSCADPGEGVQL